MYLGIDIGGTKGLVSSFNSPDDIEPLQSIPFGMTSESRGNADFSRDFEELRTACSIASRGSHRIEGVGLAIAGKLNDNRSGLVKAGNTSHWVGHPIRDMLSDWLNCPVVLGNDAEAAGLAEALYGKGQDTDFWFVIWGTGVGGCLVRRVNGASVPFAGELGHQQMPVPSDLSRLCLCGQSNCLEAFCGGNAILRQFGRVESLTPGNWRTFAKQMASGIHNVVVAQPTPLVVFGGGVICKQPQLLQTIEAYLANSLHIVTSPEVTLSEFGEAAGTVGALALLNLES